MTQTLIGLLGISGVGKSTFIKRMSDYLKFQHLQASALIEDGRQISFIPSFRRCKNPLNSLAFETA